MTYGDDAAAGELSPVEMIVVSLARLLGDGRRARSPSKKRQAIERYEIDAVGQQRDEYPQVLTEVTVTHEVWGTGPRRGGHPSRDRAVGDEVLPGQRDGLGRSDRRSTTATGSTPTGRSPTRPRAR